jgi:2-iminoacetate synthase ThiH
MASCSLETPRWQRTGEKAAAALPSGAPDFDGVILFDQRRHGRSCQR